MKAVNLKGMQVIMQLPFGSPFRARRGDHVRRTWVFQVRADVHAPTKSVSAQAAISVVLIFHVIFMARQYKGADRTKLSDDHRHVGVMPATPSINTLNWCAEKVRTRLPCDLDVVL